MEPDERLQSEYQNEDEEERHLIILKEIEKWQQLFAFTMLSLVLVISSLLLDFSYSFGIIPFMFLDVLILLQIYKGQQQETSQIKLRTKHAIPDIAENIGSLLAKVLYIIAVFSDLLHISAFIPLSIGTISKFIYRNIGTSECQSFSTMVNNIQLQYIGRIVKVLAVLILLLYFDQIIDWSLSTIFWPIWVGISLLFLVSLGIFLLFIAAILTWISNACSYYEVVCTFWLLFTTSGISLSCFGIIWSISKYEQQMLQISCMGAFIHLCFFMIFTTKIKTQLILWWDTFFINEGNSVYSFQVPSDLQSEVPSMIRRRTVSRQLYLAMKQPPKMLVRLSSTYFQPIEPIKQRHTRIKSLDQVKKPKKHTRFISFTPSSNNSVDEIRFCSICCTNPCDAVLMDCGHGGICFLCANSLFQQSERCFLCRAQIDQVLKVEELDKNVMKVLQWRNDTQRSLHLSEIVEDEEDN